MNCTKCNKEIADVKFCPECGTPTGEPIRKPIYARPWFWVPVVLVLIASMLLSYYNRQFETDIYLDYKLASAEKMVNTREKIEANSSFANNILENDEVKIEVTKWEVLAPGEYGNLNRSRPIVVFWYTITNKDDNSTNGMNVKFEWEYQFKLFQDNDPDYIDYFDFSDSATLYDDNDKFDLCEDGLDLKIGESASSLVGYELSDKETPITMIARSKYGRELGSVEFDIASKLASAPERVELTPDPKGPDGKLSSKDNSDKIDFSTYTLPDDAFLKTCWTVTVEEADKLTWLCYSEPNKNLIKFYFSYSIESEKIPPKGTKVKLYVFQSLFNGSPSIEYYIYGYEILG